MCVIACVRAWHVRVTVCVSVCVCVCVCVCVSSAFVLINSFLLDLT